MREAVDALSEKLLTLQGDGDHAGAGALIAEMGEPAGRLQADMDRINEAGIPTDIIFVQGVEVLGLN